MISSSSSTSIRPPKRFHLSPQGRSMKTYNYEIAEGMED